MRARITSTADYSDTSSGKILKNGMGAVHSKAEVINNHSLLFMCQLNDVFNCSNGKFILVYRD